MVGRPSFYFINMKKIDISSKRHPNTFAIIDDEDFEYLNQWKWYYHQGYAHRTLHLNSKKAKTISMHRTIMKEPKDKLVDHINMNGLDNRKSNLRICNKKENSRNSGIQKNNKSGYVGVSKNSSSKKLWQVRIGYNGNKIHLGYFNDKIEAAKAYNEKALELYGEYARLNIIED